MKRSVAVENHLKICDELYALILEENRILRQDHCLPGQAFSTRKEGLLLRLNESVAGLQTAERDAGAGPSLAKAKDRSMQIIRLDRENEQLLLRYSLGPRRPVITPSLAAAAQMYAARLPGASA